MFNVSTNVSVDLVPSSQEGTDAGRHGLPLIFNLNVFKNIVTL